MSTLYSPCQSSWFIVGFFFHVLSVCVGGSCSLVGVVAGAALINHRPHLWLILCLLLKRYGLLSALRQFVCSPGTTPAKFSCCSSLLRKTINRFTVLNQASNRRKATLHHNRYHLHHYQHNSVPSQGCYANNFPVSINLLELTFL